MNPQQALLLIGSPKPKKSVSRSLGQYLLSQWIARGGEGEIVHIHTALKTEAGRGELLAAVARADLLILAFPLYVDSLPSAVIEAIELIAGQRDAGSPERQKRLLALVNCGYPEAGQNDVALRICRQFAREADFEWAGGFGLGGGPTLRARPLESLGSMAGNLRSALEIAARALIAGEEVPGEAFQLMRTPLIPHFLYRMMVSLNWYHAARRNRVAMRLHARPYQNVAGE